jgi:preprotein translocase subunit SecA
MERVLEVLGNALGKVFGSANDRLLKRYWRTVEEEINPRESKMLALPDAAFRPMAAEWRKRLAEGATLDDLLPEVFAAVREAARRTVLMRHYDVQLIGGMALHQGKISEMVTGEGKTLVATTAVTLNALGGKGVHLVTVNDYLARRDAQWMGPIYDFVGLTVGVIQHERSFRYDRDFHPEDPRYERLVDCDRREAYAQDIVYGTNNEFGFDYLRDNMKVTVGSQVQRGHNFAVVDEVDSILVDEARTPLIISGPAQESTDKYYKADRVARQLKRGELIEQKKKEDMDPAEVRDREKDFIVKEKEHTVYLTDPGIEKAQRLAGIDDFYSGENMDWEHYIVTALKAHHLYKRDQEYVIKDGEVIIVDEFTGRMMPGRRWSDGLHQAVEAKEGLRIREESQTLATITLQNYFKMYEKLAGMTGTAATEAAEFEKIYKLGVCIVPTNKLLRRTASPDCVYGTEEEKFDAIEEEIAQLHQTGRPILVGTTSIEKSEILSERLKMRGIKHEVLNAKQHEREALIVAQAGQRGSVTIATNMAGRGTDILLGAGVAELGGLHILGTERHESRRIDNQLRGRAGRQGDPGSSQFFLSLEDDLFRKFAPPWVRAAMRKMGLKEGEVIQSGMVTRSIGRAQKNVEGHNFQIRKNLLEYDEIKNEQRRVIYGLRSRILSGENVRETVMEMIRNCINGGVMRCTDEQRQLDREGLARWFAAHFGIPCAEEALPGGDGSEAVASFLEEKARQAYVEREAQQGAERMREMERLVLLDRIDDKWKDLLYNIDQLRDTIGLRAFAQQDPKLEYKREATELFGAMMESIEDEVASLVFKVVIREDQSQRLQRRWSGGREQKDEVSAYDASQDPAAGAGGGDEKPEPFRGEKKTGRNEPCPCGSGKKYKKCCGKNAS